MAKSRRTITVALPAYQRNRERWRREILASVLSAGHSAGVRFDPQQSFEVVVLLYLTEGKRHDIHDVDNRLKDILDTSAVWQWRLRDWDVPVVGAEVDLAVRNAP